MIVAPAPAQCSGGGWERRAVRRLQGVGCAATCTNIGTDWLTDSRGSARCVTWGLETSRTSAAPRPGACCPVPSGLCATPEAVDATSATPTQPATAKSAHAIDLRADWYCGGALEVTIAGAGRSAAGVVRDAAAPTGAPGSELASDSRPAISCSWPPQSKLTERSCSMIVRSCCTAYRQCSHTIKWRSARYSSSALSMPST